VLVVGTAGVGKTSLVNCLTGQAHPVGTSGRGRAFDTKLYQPMEKNGTPWVFCEATGLEDAWDEAIHDHVEQLLTNIKELNLVIMVFKQGRITLTAQRNYELFVQTLTGNKVPVICVVTGCENDESMQSWAKEHEASFAANNMNFKKVVGGCCAAGGRMEPVFADLREETKQAVWEAIDDWAESQPVMVTKNEKQTFWQRVISWLSILQSAVSNIFFQKALKSQI